MRLNQAYSCLDGIAISYEANLLLSRNDWNEIFKEIMYGCEEIILKHVLYWVFALISTIFVFYRVIER